MSGERFDTWMQTATRYFVLANAGGAVVVLSFLGAKADRGLYSYFAVAALFCFVAGLIVAGLAIMGQLTGAYREFLASDGGAIAADASIKKHSTTRLYDWFEPRTGRLLAIAFGLFTGGALIGVLGLAVALLC